MMAKAASRNEFEAGPWRILVVKSHILRSSCERGKEEGCEPGAGGVCSVCRWVRCVHPPTVGYLLLAQSDIQR